MAPPFHLTENILSLVSEISHLLGKLHAVSAKKPEPKLRRKNRVLAIKSTLAIEGHTFTEDQITAVIEKKNVIGTRKEIREVQNAIELYENISLFKMSSEKSFLKAHAILMNELILSSGKYRSKNVGILKGQQVKHVAPKPNILSELMNRLFKWIKEDKKTHPLIKSCIVHYEIEFIHPFEDGNGRMGRFWQTLILSTYNPLFQYVPIESLIEKNQEDYYKTLEICDKQGDSTPFIEFMLEIILSSLKYFDGQIVGISLDASDRLATTKEHFKNSKFTRRQYMEFFKTISTATASRDLKEGIDTKQLRSEGSKNQTKYFYALE